MATSNVFCYQTPLTQSRKMRWTGGPIERKYLRGEIDYNPRHVITTKVVFHRNTMIALNPRFKDGNPYSLVSCRTDYGFIRSFFKPYPSLSVHNEPSEGRIFSVVDICADKSNRLWVLDSGVINSLVDPEMVSEPKILCINMDKKTVIEVIKLGEYLPSKCEVENILYYQDKKRNEILLISEGIRGRFMVYNINNKTIININYLGAFMRRDNIDDSIGICIINKKLLIARKFSSYIYSFDLSHLYDFPMRELIGLCSMKRRGMALMGHDGISRLYVGSWSKVYEHDINKRSVDKHLRTYEITDNYSPLYVFYDQDKDLMRIMVANLNEYGECEYGVTHKVNPLGMYMNYSF